MRMIVGLAFSLFCGVATGQQGRQMFELPFAQNPPPVVDKIMQDALKDLNRGTDQVFDEAEGLLQKALDQFQLRKKLADANFTQATLDVYKNWLLRNTLYEHCPSPVGKWKKTEGSFTMTINADGTVSPSWHSHGSLWNQDGLGNVRMIFHATNRGVHEFRLDDGGNKLVAKNGSETYLRIP